jgi:hypothetical protein
MSKQTFWESEVYTLREQIQLIETERNILVCENEAMRTELKSLRQIVDALIIKADAFDYLAWLEKKRGEEVELQGADFLCLTSDGTTCWGKTYLEAVRIAEQQDRIAFDSAAKKESGDDAIMRQHLTEGGTPT